MSLVTPPVGWPIQFLPNGDKEHPCPAFVTASGLDGQVKLNFMYANGGTFLHPGRFVRNAEDQWVKDNPEQVQKNGCWQWVPGLVYEPVPEVPQAKAEPDESKEDKREQGLAKIDEYVKEGLSPEEIAPKVRSYGISKAEVEELLSTVG